MVKISLSILILGILSLAFYFLYFPPRVIDINSELPLVIKFDKPVKRQNLQPSISSQVFGEWKFEDPLIKNHLFRTLTFTPAVDLEPDTQYQVRLENIINPLGFGRSNTFAFHFKTEPLLDEQAEQSKPTITIEEIMEKIGYDPAPRRGNIWGDPYLAYVGKINGKVCDTGYGVYWEPVAEAASHWREAEAFSGWELKDLAREIKLGNPVIAWGTLPVSTLNDCSWYTPKGKYIKALRETHVRLVVGFIGEAENPFKIIINDPLAGRLYWPADYFLANWRTFGYSGVVVK